MGGSVATDHTWSFASVPAVFRFSPRPNQAHQIHWRAWGSAAFAEAIQQDKPIFLVISTVWSEASHLLDEKTLSEPSVIAIVNADFLPVRVDADLRPDVNQRYNQNGWPSIVLLSAEGEVLWGGIYTSPQKLLYCLGHMRRYYSEHRQDIAEQAHHLLAQRQASVSPGATKQPFTTAERLTLLDIPRSTEQVLRDLYDAEHGGFTLHPTLKFPHPEALEVLLHAHTPEALQMVCYSLAQMRDGGLWDVEGGGFFHYATSEDWSLPHTAKMLDENAALLRVIAMLAAQTQDQQWFALARQLIEAMQEIFWQPQTGAFSGSQCADEGYYEPGQYSRASRVAPPVDEAIYTAWNARAISAYLLAATVLDDAQVGMIALGALDYLCTNLTHPQGGMFHVAQGEHVALPGQLADQVWMTQALLDGYAFSGQERYLNAAIAVMHYTLHVLFDTQSGLFYDAPDDPMALGRLVIREQSLIENALAAGCLLRMAAYSKRQSLRATGLHILVHCREMYRRTGIQGATYASIVVQAIAQQWV